jgi:hypothetical protein
MSREREREKRESERESTELNPVFPRAGVTL